MAATTGLVHAVDHHRQPRVHRRLAEFGDVGSGKEGLPFADDHRGGDVVGGFRFLDGGHEPLAHGGAKRVHRRIVGRDDEHVAVAGGGDRAGHGWSPNKSAHPEKRLSEVEDAS
jgi:hypothetical protein